jgi:cell division protein FtsQ
VPISGRTGRRRGWNGEQAAVEDVRREATVRRSRAPERRALPRAVALVVCGAVLAGLAYVVARETSLFALRTVDVRGASEPVVEQAREALAALVGGSLVSVSTDDVVRRLEALPTIVSASAERDFPHTLRVELREERPVAVVRHGDGAWMVSARGRVMESVAIGSAARLPRVWLGVGTASPRPGVYLLPNEGGLVIEALARVPDDFPVEIAAARGSVDELVLVVEDTKAELRLGEAAELRLKLAVAATVLDTLGTQERRELSYLDVSLPTRPVGAYKSQVEA